MTTLPYRHHPQRETILRARPLPTRIGEHRPNDYWHCQWCPSERWPCRNLMRQALAYFWSRPSDLWAFMRSWMDYARDHPEFRHATAEALQERFMAWIEPAIRAQHKLEQARNALNTGARRALSLIPEKWRSLHESLLDTSDGIRIGRHRSR